MDAILECPAKIKKTQEISGCPLLIFSSYNKLLQIRAFKKIYKHGAFLRTDFNCFKTTETLGGDSLLLATKYLGVPGTHLINLGGTKD